MYKFIVFDFDGVFTDGKVIFDNKNNVNKYYNIKDGKGLSLLREKNIKIGLLSNFNNEKEIFINNLPIKNLIEHLKFDKFFIGKGSKLDILKKWLEEEKIIYENVAYIGDDINDIEVIRKVKFSACPNDAIEAVKNKVNYICNLKGGEGCVREFIDIILKGKPDLKQEIKKELNYQIDNFNFNNINFIADKIKLQKNNIYFMGIGKSGNIAKHCCDLLKSISINCYYLDSVNLLHGDIGSVRDNLVILFSKSGNTKELIDLIPFLKVRNCYLIGICCDKKNTFEKYCDYVYYTPFSSEIKGEINKIPTNSIISHLLFSNILVSKLKEKITIDKYKNNHPAGDIGKNLLKIKDCIIYDFPKIILNKKVLLHLVLLEMTKYKIGCCFFIDICDKLVGILTDGDIRRLLLKNSNLKFINSENINKNYFYEENINKYINEYKKYIYIPILKNKKLLGIINNISS